MQAPPPASHPPSGGKPCLSIRQVTACPLRLILIGLALVATAAFAVVCYGPPDKRTWEQVTANFAAREAEIANDGQYDGRRLKELDSKRGAAFLIPFLSKDQKYGVRVKAIGALGWASFQEAIPALSAIALDPSENDPIRGQVLNPGLRYMKHPEAVKTASALANDKSAYIRSGALWVLSNHGTDEAIEVLAARLRANDKPLLWQLMNALTLSGHPRAGKIVFDLVDFAAVQKDEGQLVAYATAMAQYHIPEAQQNMLALAKQPDHLLSEYVLQYFSAFPREDLVSKLVAHIEADKDVSFLHTTVTEFIKSPKISPESKAKLSAFISSGKVMRSDEIFR